jgi:hypothetical protein
MEVLVDYIHRRRKIPFGLSEELQEGSIPRQSRGITKRNFFAAGAGASGLGQVGCVTSSLFRIPYNQPLISPHLHLLSI